MSVFKILLLALAPIALLLSGCASQQERLADDLRDRERAMRKLEEDRREWAQEDAHRQLGRYPDWALSPAPAPDSSGVYAIGIGESDQPQIALRKATMQGTYGLARQMQQAVSGMERQHVSDNGATSNDSYRNVIESLVDWTDVTGWESVRQEVVAIDGRPHAFVLLKLPFATANQVLQERRRNATLDNEKAVFDELQRRLEVYRASRPAPQVNGMGAAPVTVVEQLPAPSAE